MLAAAAIVNVSFATASAAKIAAVARAVVVIHPIAPSLLTPLASTPQIGSVRKKSLAVARPVVIKLVSH